MPPLRKNERGDQVYERTRREAIAKLEAERSKVLALQSNGNLEQAEGVPVLAAKVIPPLPLDKIWSRWYHEIPGEKIDLETLGAVGKDGKKKRLKGHPANVRASVTSLILNLRSQNPDISDAAQITTEMASHFIRCESKRVTSKTTKNRLIDLKAVFNLLKEISQVAANPFEKVKMPVKVKMVHRQRLVIDELKKIMVAAQADLEVGPMVIAAMCTALRRNDAAKLRWRDVDFEKVMIATRAAKTGVRVWIPLMGALKDCLVSRERRGEFCFPALAKMASENPDGLNWRLAQIFEAAEVKEVAAHEDLGPRKRKPAKHGWHSFKVAFVSLALEANIPMSLVQTVVGNQVVDVVLKHYYQPDQARAWTEFMTKMPSFMTGQKPPDSPIIIAVSVLKEMTTKNWRAKREQLISLFEKAGAQDQKIS